jgi:poly-gamma-glutamate synthesis protein (capsule biosynthesis protein)
MADRRRSAGRALAIVGFVAIALAASGAVVTSVGQSTLRGRVIDLAGHPIEGATVRMAGAQASTDRDGAFSLRTADRGGWVRADADRFLPRIRPAHVDHDVLLRLTPDDGHTISLVFGGDVMFGRRYFDPNEDGDTGDGIISPTSSAAELASLFGAVPAALGAADLAIVNLETPLVSSPIVAPASPRPSGWHPTKEFVFASAPAAAGALRSVGVDVVGLGNNHLFDHLEDGVAETTQALDSAGFTAGSGRVGAGADAASAWQPAVRSARGTTVAVLACTTIDGRDQQPDYIAEATKGGAAECTEDGIVSAVRAARATADLVVMMIHGGYEYDRSPSPQIRRLSEAARAAGAALVVDHHPHVVGGFQRDGADLTAWTMGNLLFDQTVWPTFESYLLTVYVRNGAVVRATADPLVIDDFRPKGLVGGLANHVARDAAGWEPGPFVVEDGSVEIATPSAITRRSAEVVATGPPDGAIFSLPGATAVRADSVGAVDVGRDLLWTGDFESASSGLEPPLLWQGPSKGGSVTSEAAKSGAAGYRLRRTGASSGDIVVAPSHRIPIEPGTKLSLLAAVRMSGDASAALQLDWYNDLRGGSQVQTVVAIPATDPGTWREVRIDVTAPLAVLPLARLGSPNAGEATLDLDDVRLVEWHPLVDASLRTDFVRVRGGAALRLEVSGLAGSAEVPAAPVLRDPPSILGTPSVPGLPPGPDPAKATDGE